jgi:hypothetical protein
MLAEPLHFADLALACQKNGDAGRPFAGTSSVGELDQSPVAGHEPTRCAEGVDAALGWGGRATGFVGCVARGAVLGSVPLALISRAGPLLDALGWRFTRRFPHGKASG